MLLPIGESTRKFAHRGLTLIGASEESRTLLTEIYRLRSCAEHMNDTDELLSQSPDPPRSAWKRSFQSEIIASEAYAHLFTTPNLLMRFRDDAEISALWREPDGVGHKIWGSPLDLDAAMNRLYRPIFGLER